MEQTGTAARWLHPLPHDSRRSIDVVRIVLALIIVAHPLNTLAHPPLLQALARSLTEHGLPWGLGLAWLALGFQILCSLALLTRRAVVPAALGTIAVLTAGIVLFYAPYWYVAGGAADDEHPGVEFNVLLIACLAGVLWTYWPRRRPDADAAARRGLDIVRVSSALLLSAHPLHAFTAWDIEGMRQWGEAMSRRGFPCGVPLVWGVTVLQIVCSLALVTRRGVVPACLGHIAVLCTGIVVVHAPNWFMIGPEHNGMEFPLTYITCFVSFILAYWPRRRAVAAPAPAIAPVAAG